MRTWSTQFLNCSQHSYKLSPFNCRIPQISFMILATLDAGKYFSKNSFFISFQVVTVLDGKYYSHSLALSARENENALNFTCSSKIPVGFMLEQTTWNSFKCLLGSSPTKPWKVGKSCIISDFNSNATSSWGYCMHKGYWSRSGVANSLRYDCCWPSWMVQDG